MGSIFTMLTKNVLMPMNVLIHNNQMETAFVEVPSVKILLVHFHVYVLLDILITTIFKSVFNLHLDVEKLNVLLDVML